MSRTTEIPQFILLDQVAPINLTGFWIYHPVLVGKKNLSEVTLW